MGTMPDPDDETGGEREDSAYRFQVVGHPELGEFVDWDPAVAAAWSVTKPGNVRTEVTLAEKGVVQPRVDADEWVVLKDDATGTRHTVKKINESIVIMTHCKLSRNRYGFTLYSRTAKTLPECGTCNWNRLIANPDE